MNWIGSIPRARVLCEHCREIQSLSENVITMLST